MKYTAVFFGVLLLSSAFTVAAVRRPRVDPECAALGFSVVIEDYKDLSATSTHAGNAFTFAPHVVYLSDIQDDAYSFAQNVGVGVVIRTVDGRREEYVFNADQQFASVRRSGRYMPDSIDAIKVCANQRPKF